MAKIERQEEHTPKKHEPKCPDCGWTLSLHPCRETRWDKGERLEIGYWMAKCWNPSCKRENQWIDPLEYF